MPSRPRSASGMTGNVADGRSSSSPPGVTARTSPVSFSVNSSVPSGRNAMFVGKETSWRNGSGVAPAGTFTSMSRAVKADRTARRTSRRYREMTRCMRVGRRGSACSRSITSCSQRRTSTGGERLHRDGDRPVTGLEQMSRERPVTRGRGRGPRSGRRGARCRPRAGTRSAGTSSGEPATLACVIGPGTSISDSTPPSDSARKNSSVRRATSSAFSALADPERHHAAEIGHLPAGDRRGRGGPRAPGRAPASRPGGSPR